MIPEDETLLDAFRCSDGAWYEEEVERFIREELLASHRTRAPHTDHRIIGLELPEHGLVAVTAHEEDLIKDAGEQVTSTFWHIAAVSLECRGALLPDIEPLDDDHSEVTLGRYLAEVTLSDIAARERVPVVRGVVARENRRSLALCDRVGLIRELPDRDRLFVQRWGRMSEAG